MDLRRVLEDLGLDVRGFFEGLGVDVARIEAAVGLPIEVMTVALTAVFALLLGTVAVRAVLRRRALPAGDAVDAEPGPRLASEPTRVSDAQAMRKGLAKTRGGFLAKLDALLGRGGLDEALVEELETLLVTSDLGIRAAQRLISDLEANLTAEARADPAAVKAQLIERVAAIVGTKLPPWSLSDRPTVVMVIGVNGVGKTTTIGKLAARYARQGKKVVLAAGDTFRAAAVEQLEVWGERAGVEVVKGAEGADPASVMFAAVERARAVGADLLLCDTAGRLQTKVNLMNELGKVKRVIGKAMPGAPHEVLMVLDATTGQNAISQAQKFSEAVAVDSLALTKLDGTAKGGVVVAIADELSIPVRFVGIGEGVDDLRDFDPADFVRALFAED